MSAEIQRNEARETPRTLHYWIRPIPGAFIKWGEREVDGWREKIRESGSYMGKKKTAGK